MTPKEKAQELVDRVDLYASELLPDGTPDETGFNKKQIALIVIEEILNSFKSFMHQKREFRNELEIGAEKYYLEVKKEVISENTK